MKVVCASCGHIQELPEKVGFRDTCLSCSAYLHSCVNCRFWVSERCSEPSAEKTADPAGINFCDWYKEREESFDKAPGPEPVEGRGGPTARGPGREQAEELWKKLTKK